MPDTTYPLEPELVKTKEETDKKCPSCGGTMDFDPSTGGLSCPYCGHTEEIARQADAPASAVELDFDSAYTAENCNWGASVKTVICKSCGAQSIYDALQISDVCPYCGSNQVMEEHGVDTLAPGGVCPFKITEKQAGENFTTWIKRKLFCPSVAKKSAKPDSFQGVYLPYWTYDANTYTQYTARYGIDHTSTDSDGNETTHTSWYRTSGDYSQFIDDALVIATTRYDEDILSRVEPFDTADNVAYKPEYIAGFVSERYSVGLKEGWERAKQIIHSVLSGNIESKILSEHNADHVDSLHLNTNYSNVTFKYLLLPIWLSSFKYKQKIYSFMVNGQTGRVGGKSPVSPLRVAIAILLGLVVLGVLVYFFGG